MSPSLWLHLLALNTAESGGAQYCSSSESESLPGRPSSNETRILNPHDAASSQEDIKVPVITRRPRQSTASSIDHCTNLTGLPSSSKWNEQCSILSLAEADKYSNSPAESSSQQVKDETFPTPNSSLNAPPLAPELPEGAAPELILGPVLERIAIYPDLILPFGFETISEPVTTSAIDYETDTIIHNSLCEDLGRDVTVLTVVRRLQSIMDADKIMVLDAGNIIEYDKPSELLKKKDGYFRGLVDESGDKAALYTMAGYPA